jgi:ComF family protein
MLEQAVDVLFPRACVGCGAGPWPFCAACADQLVPLTPPWCRRCSRPAERDVDSCRDCPPRPITSARAAFAYRGPAKAAVHRLKFSGWRGVGDALAAAVAALGPPPADAVTWVPLARRRRAERGFDQAKVLARALARRLDLPVVAVVRRTKATAPQARRSREQRLRAMEGAFSRIPGATSPARLLLVDDVLTTGATASACAAKLVDAGAAEVHLVTACRSFADRPAGAAVRASEGA